MVQMVGVIILALGLPQMFHSLDEGHTIDNGVMVLGYVVMRVAMIFLWLRAARQDPPRRRACQTYAVTIGVAQIGWVLLILAHTTGVVFFMWGTLLTLIELVGPIVAERGKGGTPWHAHHIAERYGLLAIITLGEGVIGTVASLSAVIGATATVLTVAVPVAVFVFALAAQYTFLLPGGDPFHISLLVGTTAVLVLAVLLATIGVPMAVCLVVLMFAPLVGVVGYETIGHRHMVIALQRALAD